MAQIITKTGAEEEYKVDSDKVKECCFLPEVC